MSEMLYAYITNEEGFIVGFRPDAEGVPLDPVFCQGGIPPLKDSRGNFVYKLVDGAVTFTKTQEAIDLEAAQDLDAEAEAQVRKMILEDFIDKQRTYPQWEVEKQKILAIKNPKPKP